MMVLHSMFASVEVSILKQLTSLRESLRECSLAKQVFT